MAASLLRLAIASPLLLAACAALPPAVQHPAVSPPAGRPALRPGAGRLPEPALEPRRAHATERSLAPVLAKAAEPEAAEAVPKTTSVLASGLRSPMPGGVLAGYAADTGLDIAGSPSPVYAIASGFLDYSEPGHTRWTGPRDTTGSVRIELDEPIPFRGRAVTHVWYAHLSELAVVQAEGALPRRRVAAGELLGRSGTARGSPHLHLGLLLDGETDQSWGTFLLEDEIRELLGGYRGGARLPRP